MARSGNRRKSEHTSMLFSAWNYKVLSIGLLLIVTGFTAMYLENEVYGFISLFISPILIVAGYITVIVAILKQDDQTGTAPDHTSN